MKKGSKIVIQVSISVADTFADFMLSRKAKGLSEKTLITYNQHLSAIGKHLDLSIPIDELTKHFITTAIYDYFNDCNYQNCERSGSDKFPTLLCCGVSHTS